MNCLNRVADMLQLECQVIMVLGSFYYLRTKFIAALFVIAKTWKNLLNNLEINKGRDTYTNTHTIQLLKMRKIYIY